MKIVVDQRDFFSYVRGVMLSLPFNPVSFAGVSYTDVHQVSLDGARCSLYKKPVYVISYGEERKAYFTGCVASIRLLAQEMKGQCNTYQGD